MMTAGADTVSPVGRGEKVHADEFVTAVSDARANAARYWPNRLRKNAPGPAKAGGRGGPSS